jgi:GT2 family glycosyltransferase
MRTALITTVHGRHDHLRRQERLLAGVPDAPDHRVVVSMADPEVATLVGPATVVVPQPAGSAGLPLAAARNLGAAAALADGSELLVFLDVDCLPGPGTLTAYRRAAAGPSGHDLLSGVVVYLPPPPPEGYDPQRLGEHPGHPARPVPPAGVEVPGADHRLFWSLSFAVRASTWARIGGFDEQYEGYGGEDTDFALRARQQGVGFTWVGGAEAYHQWHPSGSPPVRHLDDILRNGARFARRWGFWPMQGWLEQFAELGLVQRAGAGWVRA